MRTMKQPFPEIPWFQAPVLHRVKYNPKYNYDSIRMWISENCKNASYFTPNWNGSFVEFEDDEDATFFALRWS